MLAGHMLPASNIKFYFMLINLFLSNNINYIGFNTMNTKSFIFPNKTRKNLISGGDKIFLTMVFYI